MSGQTEEADTQDIQGFDDYQTTLGDILRGERATLGKSLLDVQRDIRIKADYLAAIEETNPAGFDSPGFISGYVRSYARYLGVDPDWCYRRFCEESGFKGVHGAALAPANEPTRPRRPGDDAALEPKSSPTLSYLPEHQRWYHQLDPGALGSVAVLAILIGMIGFGGWSILQEVQRVQVVPLDNAPGVTSTVELLAPVADATRADAAPVTADALAGLYRPRALDFPVLEARDGPIASLDPDRVGMLAPPAAPPSLPQIAPPSIPTDGLPVTAAGTPTDAAPALDDGAAVIVTEPGPAPVSIVALSPAWVRVTGPDGAVLFEKIMDAGEAYQVPDGLDGPATLRAGNAGDVYFTHGGQTFGPAGAPGTIAKNIPLVADAMGTKIAQADPATRDGLADILRVADAAAVTED